MADALPDTTLPIYPGLGVGQAPNMLACMPSGLVQSLYCRRKIYEIISYTTIVSATLLYCNRFMTP